jgi:hypothetical protein
VAEEQLHIEYPPDLELLAEAADQGYVIASEGTDRFASMNALVEMGLLQKHFCPRAGGVHQFTITRNGADALVEESRPHERQ